MTNDNHQFCQRTYCGARLGSFIFLDVKFSTILLYNSTFKYTKIYLDNILINFALRYVPQNDWPKQDFKLSWWRRAHT